MEAWRYRAFGLELASDVRLPGLQASPGRNAELSLHVRSELPPAPGPWAPLWSTVAGGHGGLTIERSAAGAHRLDHSRYGRFLLTAELDELVCAPTELEDPGWRRLLLDTVLFSTALLRGGEALHASAVTLDEGAVAFVAAEGGGKSTLAAELVRRGRPLLADDVLFLGERDGAVAGLPGPAVMNLAAGTPLGERLATIDGEDWVAVAPAAAEPAPLAAVVFLARAAGAPTTLTEIDATALDLLPHTLALDAEPARAARRFEILSDLVTSVPVLRLSAGLTAPAQSLADRVEAAVAARSRVSA